MADKEWQDRVKGILKAELKRRNLSYADLSAKLAEIGISETELNIKNKISRGGFSAVFFVQCLRAIGVKQVNISDVD
jgi:3-mercaptopyruvate sulfurtransferase SseA